VKEWPRKITKSAKDFFKKARANYVVPVKTGSRQESIECGEPLCGFSPLTGCLARLRGNDGSAGNWSLATIHYFLIMLSPTPPPDDKPVRAFASQKAWNAWLDKQHTKSPGLWMQLMKKGSGKKSITYPEAVEEALCYGWIDGQKRSYDETSWLQKFTPRGKKSVWSKINRGKVAALVKAGRMKPAGLATVKAAKADGRWEAAYDSQSFSSVPGDFQELLAKRPGAAAFFKTLKSASRYAILYRLHTVKKAETRTRKMHEFVAMLDEGEAPHLFKPKAKP
jgi:uncharacterized protein YdeI (YjbR/CyaY-like superfamily)